jgi:hypothetical protein
MRGGYLLQTRHARQRAGDLLPVGRIQGNDIFRLEMLIGVGVDGAGHEIPHVEPAVEIITVGTKSRKREEISLPFCDAGIPNSRALFEIATEIGPEQIESYSESLCSRKNIPFLRLRHKRAILELLTEKAH